MNRRSDRVVIMARGESSRMGRPKGSLATPDGSGDSFLRKIIDLYSRIGMKGVVVTTIELTEFYQSLAGAENNFEVFGFTGGGDTARTLSFGWSVLEESTTHVWAHPVDLPLVVDATIMRLKQESLDSPLKMIRPSFNETIGHPVILPTAGALDFSKSETWYNGPMRRVIVDSHQNDGQEAPVLIAVNDPGVVQDFDNPEDLKESHF